jgi:hypothetical protein
VTGADGYAVCYQSISCDHEHFFQSRTCQECIVALTFSPAQFETFSAPDRDAWIAQAAARLHQSFHSHYTALGRVPADLVPVCHATERWAAAYGITGERDVSQLCCLAASLGHQFWQDPRFEGHVAATLANPALARPGVTPLLMGHAQDWLTLLWQNDTLGAFADRLTAILRRNLEPDLQVLHAVLPGHWIALDEGFNSQFLQWLYQTLPPTSFAAQRMAALAIALVHGAQWWHDPQYLRFAEILATAGSPDALADALSAVYGGIA